MYCAIYKSRKKQDTYLYMASKDDFSRVPTALLALLGNPVYVMEIELNAERRLAQENVLEVIRNLQERGWHLQMPRREDWPGMH